MWRVAAAVLFTAWSVLAFYGIVVLARRQDPAWMAVVLTYLGLCVSGLCGNLYESKCQRSSHLSSLPH